MGVKTVTQLEHDQLPSLRLLTSTIRAVAFFIDATGGVPKCRRESLVRFLFETAAWHGVYDDDRPIGGIVGRLYGVVSRRRLN